jgi:hypothetical protein
MFLPPPSPRRQHFRENFFRCPFQYPKVPLEAGAPQSFDASYAPVADGGLIYCREAINTSIGPNLEQLRKLNFTSLQESILRSAIRCSSLTN